MAKKIKISEKLKTQLLDLVNYHNLNKLNGHEITKDKFDTEASTIQQASKLSSEWTYNFLLEFLSLTPQEKSRIEKLHLEVVKTSYARGSQFLTIEENERYLEGMKEDFGYDLKTIQ